jgi:hypothetical protein
LGSIEALGEFVTGAFDHVSRAADATNSRAMGHLFGVDEQIFRRSSPA